MNCAHPWKYSFALMVQPISKTMRCFGTAYSLKYLIYGGITLLVLKYCLSLRTLQ